MRASGIFTVFALMGLGVVAFAGARRADAAAAAGTAASRPAKGPIHVAFVLTQGANVMDFAGPWEVFQDVWVPELGGSMDDQMPFRLFTVSDSNSPVEMTGGLRVAPAYTFANAPGPDVVVVGAQAGSPAMLDWLKKASAHATVMSVCTGAFKLAKAGLLDGHPATTHHDFLDQLEKGFPKVQVQHGRRWVKSSDRVYTAGGLTSGIDLALHIVAEYYGDDVAARTSFYLEHVGDGWKDASSTPVAATRVGK